MVVVVVTGRERMEEEEEERWVGDFSNAWKQKAQPEIRDREKFSIGTIDGGREERRFSTRGGGRLDWFTWETFNATDCAHARKHRKISRRFSDSFEG